MASTAEGITNIDLSNVQDLVTFSIQNCTNLTGTIDLSSFANLEEVDASGTNVNVLIPNRSKITKYELGSPTQISIINPTTLQPDGIKVDSYANITDLVIKNIPNTKSYQAFEKIFKTYMFGGLFVRGFQIDRDNGYSTSIPFTEPLENKNQWYISPYISVIQGHSITIESSQPYTIYMLNSQYRVADGARYDKFESSTTISIGNDVEYIVFGNIYADTNNSYDNTTVTDTTTNTILFKYIRST